MRGQGRRRGRRRGRGQGSSSNSYANNFGFNQQQLEILFQFWLDMNSNHDANGPNPLNGLTSNINNQEQTSFVALLNEIHENRSGRGQRLERTNSEHGRVGDGPPITQGNIDLNATYDENSNYLVPQTVASLNLHLSKPGGQEADWNPCAIDSSGTTSYVLKEDDRGQSDSSNGRRLSCKRRTPEGVSRQLLLGSSSSSGQQARNSEQTNIIAQENTIISGAWINHANISNLGQLEAGREIGRGVNSANREIPNAEGAFLEAGIGAVAINHQSSSIAANRLLQGSSVNGLGPASVIGVSTGMMHQASNQARQAEIFQRNIRSRRNANQQDFLPVGLSTRNTINSHLQSPSQNAKLFPHEHFLNPILLSPVQATPTMPSFVQAPSPFQNLQLSRGVNMPTVRESSTSAAFGGNRRDAQRQEWNLINNPGDIFLHPELELGELSPVATNLNLANRNIIFGNASTSSSRDGPNRRPYIPTWLSNPIFENNYFPRLTVAAAARQEIENSARDDNNTRPRLRPRWSRLMPRAERENGGYPDIHPALQPSSTQRRGRQLLSEVHNAMAFLRRSGGLRFEDFMVIDNSMFRGLPEEDIHEDMRLDIDDMSYEELLALGEEIGHVSTGLNEKDIPATLRLYKHLPIEDGSTVNDDPCCICQEEYADGEDMGKLDCGHEFHVNCIKQWLMQKNLCPICKRTGLANVQGEQ